MSTVHEALLEPPGLDPSRSLDWGYGDSLGPRISQWESRDGAVGMCHPQVGTIGKLLSGDRACSEGERGGCQETEDSDLHVEGQ